MPITKRTPIGNVVKDFEKSKAPQFKGKSKAKRMEMAVAAALSARDKKKTNESKLQNKMTKKELKELVKNTFNEVTYVGAAAVDDMAKDPKFQAVKDKPTAINKLKTGGAVELGEASTSKYDNDPSLKGGQKNLPDSLQAGIIKAAKKKGVKSEAVSYFPDKKGGFERIDTGKKDPTQVALDRLLQRYKDEESELGGGKEINENYLKDYTNNELALTVIELSKQREGAKSRGYTAIADLLAKDIEEVKAELASRKKSPDQLGEDLDVGHQDNEPEMLVADLYRIAKYATELAQIVSELGKLDGEVDFPHWWQSKVIKAKEYMVGAKHYLDGKLKTGQAFD